MKMPLFTVIGYIRHISGAAINTPAISHRQLLASSYWNSQCCYYGYYAAIFITHAIAIVYAVIAS